MDFDKEEVEYDKKYNSLINLINDLKWGRAELKVAEKRYNDSLAELFFLYINRYIPHLQVAQLDEDMDKEFEACYA